MTQYNLVTMKDLLIQVENELERAIEKYSPHHSAHEAYCVLYEEVDELWDHVKMKPGKRDVIGMRRESIQVAAMALRFYLDCLVPDGKGYGK